MSNWIKPKNLIRTNKRSNERITNYNEKTTGSNNITDHQQQNKYAVLFEEDSNNEETSLPNKADHDNNSNKILTAQLC